MHYQIASHRTEEFLHERNDCTVRALKNVTAVPYQDAHEWFKRHGRRDGHGVKLMSILRSVAILKTIVYGYRVTIHLDAMHRADRLTLAEVTRRYPKGKYILTTSGHAIALIDGVVHDAFKAGARYQVIQICQFEPSSIVETRERGNE